uniref:Uncharacterized protein n=1 Tax=Aegilops tauschii subsp. strangulata TaxID=200361 RepID=A0A453B3R9_AEGTS
IPPKLSAATRSTGLQAAKAFPYGGSAPAPRPPPPAASPPPPPRLRATASLPRAPSPRLPAYSTPTISSPHETPLQRSRSQKRDGGAAI